MKKGFTLIELMIVIAILGVVLASTMLDARALVRQPRRMEDRTDLLTREALAVDLLGRDLRQSRARPLESSPGRLRLGTVASDVEYGLDEESYLRRYSTAPGGQRHSMQLLPYPLREFSVTPVLGVSGNEAGLRVRLLGGNGLLSSGQVLTVAWRGGPS